MNLQQLEKANLLFQEIEVLKTQFEILVSGEIINFSLSNRRELEFLAPFNGIETYPRVLLSEIKNLTLEVIKELIKRKHIEFSRIATKDEEKQLKEIELINLSNQKKVYDLTFGNWFQYRENPSIYMYFCSPYGLSETNYIKLDYEEKKALEKTIFENLSFYSWSADNCSEGWIYKNEKGELTEYFDLANNTFECKYKFELNKLENNEK